MVTQKDAADWLAHTLANDELAHYGVLGMHWGVRKDDVSKPKEVKVSKTKDTKLGTDDKIVLGVYGVGAVGFLGVGVAPEIQKGYGAIGAPFYQDVIVKDVTKIRQNTLGMNRAKDFLNNELDTSVKADTIFHRVASTKETEIAGPKYATYLEDDVLRYRAGWITPGRSEFARHYVTQMQATRNITIASPASILKTIEQHMLAAGPDGESLLDKYLRVSKSNHGTNAQYLKDNPKVFADLVVHHNKTKVWGDDVGKGVSYWMQQAGYAAVTDINNTGNGARKHAVIVLDRDAFKIESRLLTQAERAAARIAQDKISAGLSITSQSKYAAIATKAASNKVVQKVVKTAVTRKL